MEGFEEGSSAQARGTGRVRVVGGEGVVEVLSGGGEGPGREDGCVGFGGGF